MNINTEQHITPAVAVTLRKESGLSQAEFWESVGSTQGSGTVFELGKRKKGIPRSVRMLIFLKYIAKLPLDVSSEKGAARTIKYGREVSLKIEAEDAAAAAAEAQRIARDAQEKFKKLAS